MRQIIIFFATVFFSFTATAFAVENVVIVTNDILPPLAYKNDQGELTGVYIEIVKEAVSKMPDYTVSFLVLPWERAKHMVKEGEAFAILPPYFHAHDWLTDEAPGRPYIWPYSLPLFTQTDVVICNEEVLDKPRTRWPEDFEGLNFAMVRGTGRTGDKFLKMVEEKKISLSLLKDTETCMKFLKAGRAQCHVAARLPFFWHLNRMIKSGEMKDLDKEFGIKLKEAIVISANDGYLGYTDINAEKNFPYKKDFSIKFDIEIYKMKKSGRIQQIINRFVEN